MCLIAIGAGVVSFEFHLFDCFSFVSVLYIIVFPNENWTDDPRLLQTPYWRSPSVPILHLDFKTNFKIVLIGQISDLNSGVSTRHGCWFPAKRQKKICLHQIVGD